MADTSFAAFGSWLRDQREAHGMSLSQAAETIGCTKAHLWNLEKGRSTNPSVVTLARIACAYEADIGDIALMAAVANPDSGYSVPPLPARVAGRPLGGRPVMGGPTIGQTEDLIRTLFAGVADKGGRPYAEHCLRVAGRLSPLASEDAVLAALLHDVVEDTATTVDDLRDLGYSERTLWLVNRLTRKPEDGTYMDYIRGIAATGDADLIAIKLADNADNSDPARIASLPPEQRDIVRRYERARRILERASPTPSRLSQGDA